MSVLSKVKEAAPQATQFAWDECCKIFILENEAQAQEAKERGFTVLDIKGNLNKAWKESCVLKFINFWDLDKDAVIPQCEDF